MSIDIGTTLALRTNYGFVNFRVVCGVFSTRKVAENFAGKFSISRVSDNRCILARLQSKARRKSHKVFFVHMGHFIFIVACENPLFSDRGGEFGGRKGGWNLHAHLTAMQTVKF